jgi:hypothetical protein
MPSQRSKSGETKSIEVGLVEVAEAHVSGGITIGQSRCRGGRRKPVNPLLVVVAADDDVVADVVAVAVDLEKRENFDQKTVFFKLGERSYKT